MHLKSFYTNINIIVQHLKKTIIITSTIYFALITHSSSNTLSAKLKELGVRKITGQGITIIFLHGGTGMTSDYLMSGFEFLRTYRTLVFYDQCLSHNLKDYVQQLKNFTPKSIAL